MQKDNTKIAYKREYEKRIKKARACGLRGAHSFALPSHWLTRAGTRAAKALLVFGLLEAGPTPWHFTQAGKGLINFSCLKSDPAL